MICQCVLLILYLRTRVNILLLSWLSNALCKPWWPFGPQPHSWVTLVAALALAAKPALWKAATALATPANKLFSMESNLMLGLLNEQNTCSSRNPLDKLEAASGLWDSLVWSLMGRLSPQGWHQAATWREAVKCCHRAAAREPPVVGVVHLQSIAASG